MPTADVCRRHGISSATFYKWKSKYGGLEVSDVLAEIVPVPHMAVCHSSPELPILVQANGLTRRCRSTTSPQ
jgi:transposase-like protein